MGHKVWYGKNSNMHLAIKEGWFLSAPLCRTHCIWHRGWVSVLYVWEKNVWPVAILTQAQRLVECSICVREKKMCGQWPSLLKRRGWVSFYMCEKKMCGKWPSLLKPRGWVSVLYVWEKKCVASGHPYSSAEVGWVFYMCEKKNVCPVAILLNRHSCMMRKATIVLYIQVLQFAVVWKCFESFNIFFFCANRSKLTQNRAPLHHHLVVAGPWGFVWPTAHVNQPEKEWYG
jgi:hypothetical protein